MLRKCAILLFASSLLGLASCGDFKIEGEDEDDDEIEIEESDEADFPDAVGTLAVDGIGVLPSVTDPVELNAGNEDQAELDSDSGALATGEFSLLKSGISLGPDTTEAKLKAIDNMSYAGCEMVNRARGVLFFSARSDELECQLGYMLGNDDKFYDGKFHVVDLIDEGTIIRIKFKVDGTKEAPTGLTAYTCEGDVQDMYLRKEIADGSAKIYAKSFSKPRNPSVDEFRGMVEVEGPVDDNGAYNGIKRIISTYGNKFSNGTNSYVREVVKQSSKSMQYAALIEQPPRDNQRLISFTRLVDLNDDKDDYKLSNLQLGDGGLAWKDGASAAVVQGWSGESGKVSNGLGLLEKIVAIKNSLPSKSKRVSLKFTGDEAYDCSEDEPEFRISYETLERKINEKLGLETGEEDNLGKCGNFTLPQDSYIQCQKFANQDGVD